LSAARTIEVEAGKRGSQKRRLDEASAVTLGFPHDMLSRPLTRGVMFGDLKIEGRA
jgi:hypothetical protein